MTQTPAMAVAEKLHGKPLRELIIDLYDEHRSVERVADILDISRATLWVWRVRMGLDETELNAIVRQRDAARREAS